MTTTRKLAALFGFSFIHEILPPELVDYVQKSLGYCLSADTSEKAIFITHGVPDAGKSTLLGTIRELLGDYATVIRIETLAGRASDNNRMADLADLCGCRFAQTSESGHDMRLAQEVMKAVTQGTLGRIKVARKHQNPFHFAESCKIWLDTNPLPVLANPRDGATLARLHPIPFQTTIVAKDQKLGVKLRAEFPGILTWLAEGFRQ